MWKSLGNPVPRETPEPYAPMVWPNGATIPLPPVGDIELGSMASALDARITRRSFSQVSQPQISALLWHTARTLQTAASPLGFAIEHRPVPSAGAIHPIHILVQSERTQGWARYCPQHHNLQTVPDADLLVRPLVELCEVIVARDEGALILFAAEPGKTASKYESADSLVWRDAGVLQGHMALVAAALGLNFCLLGVTGEPWIADLSEKRQLRGVGAAILGSRP